MTKMPRIRIGLVSETNAGFLNQAKLCLYSLRKNGGALCDIPVTLITNSDPLPQDEERFLIERFSPIEFKTSPRLGAIPHTSKLNVFYSIDPASYDILIFLDCDTVVCRPLDRILDPIIENQVEFLCRRGGETDRNSFPNFEGLVRKYSGTDPGKKIIFDGQYEWPMFNSGVFLATSDAVRKIRRHAIEITYHIYNDWLRTRTLNDLPPSVKRAISLLYRDKHPLKRSVTRYWAIEQGSLALACIKTGVIIDYLDETYNHWGGDEELHILHCFKSVYQFNRNKMFDEDGNWIVYYLQSDIPGQRMLAQMIRSYKQNLLPCGTGLIE